MIIREYWVLHFDGASKIKSSGAGLVLHSPDGFMIEYSLKLDFPTINNEVYVESELELKTIILYNVNGQIIQEIKNPSKVENNAYKVSNLPTGFYIMQLASENASTTKKLIVN